jgi:hypothetical protein
MNSLLVDLSAKDVDTDTELDVFEFNVQIIKNRYKAENITAKCNFHTFSLLENQGISFYKRIENLMIVHPTEIPTNKIFFQWEEQNGENLSK